MFKKLFAWFREEERNEEPKVLESRAEEFQVEECYDPASRPVKYINAKQIKRLKELDAKVGDPVKAICATFFDWKRWIVDRNWRFSMMAHRIDEKVHITDSKTGTVLQWRATADSDLRPVGFLWRDIPLVRDAADLVLTNMPWMTSEEKEYAALMARKAIAALADKKDYIDKLVARKRSRDNYKAGLIDRALMMEKYVGVQEGDEWDIILKEARERLERSIPTESLTMDWERFTLP